MCICVHMYICSHVYTHVCIYICVNKYTYVHIYTCMCVYRCVCMCEYTRVCICVYIYVCIYTYLYMFIYVYACLCVCIYMCVGACWGVRVCVCMCVWMYDVKIIYLKFKVPLLRPCICFLIISCAFPYQCKIFKKKKDISISINYLFIRMEQKPSEVKNQYKLLIHTNETKAQ